MDGMEPRWTGHVAIIAVLAVAVIGAASQLAMGQAFFIPSDFSEMGGTVALWQVGLADGMIPVGDPNGRAAARTMSGDVLMDAGGTTTVGALAGKQGTTLAAGYFLRGDPNNKAAPKIPDFGDLAGPGALTAQAGLLVAAADAPAAVKAKADYVCDANYDNVEIQAAINALEPNAGTVHFSIGTFDIKVPIVLKNGVSLIGACYPRFNHAPEEMNPDLYMEFVSGTRFMATGIAALTTVGRTADLEIANLVIDGDMGDGTGGCEYGIYSGGENEDGLGPAYIHGVFVLNCRTGAFHLCNPSHVRQDHCWAWNVYRGWNMFAWHAGGDQPANCLITDCYTYLCSSGQLDANHWNKSVVDGGAWFHAEKAVPTGGHDYLSYLNFITMIRFQVNGFNQTGHTLLKVSGDPNGSCPTSLVFYDLDLEGSEAAWGVDMSYTTRVQISVAACHAPVRFTHCDGVVWHNGDRGVKVACDRWTADRSVAFGYIYEPGGTCGLGGTIGIGGTYMTGGTYSMPGAWRRGDNGSLMVGGNPERLTTFADPNNQWLHIDGRFYAKEALGPVYATSAGTVYLNAEETSGLVLCTDTDNQVVKLACGVENPGARITIIKAAAGGTVKVAAVMAGTQAWTCYLDGQLCDANGGGWNAEMVHQWDSLTLERADLDGNYQWISSSRKLLTLPGGSVQALSVGVNAGVIPSSGVANAHVDPSAAIAGSKIQALSVGGNAGVIPSTGVDANQLAASPNFPRSALVTEPNADDVVPLTSVLTGNCVPVGAWGAVQSDYWDSQAGCFAIIATDPSSFYLQSYGSAEDTYLIFERGLPDSYVAGGAVQVVVKAKDSSGTAGTLGVEVYKLTNGVGGANICDPNSQSLTASWADYAFAVNPTGLAPGDLLLVRVTGNGGSGQYCLICRVAIRRDVKG